MTAATNREATTMSTYREDIRAACRSYTQTAEAAMADPDLEPWLLALVWRRDDEPTDYRVEFTLAVQGPTVTVTVDENGGTLFHHSWGCHPLTGEPRTEWTPTEADAVFWQGMAELVGDR